MKKITSFLKNNYKAVIAIVSVIIVAIVLLVWGVFAYKKNSEIRKYGLEKIEIVDVTAAQGFILNKEDWSSVPNPKGFDLVALVDSQTPLKQDLGQGYKLYVNQIGVINVVNKKGESLEFDLNALIKNYFSKRKLSEGFNQIFEFKNDEMILFAENTFRVKIYPKYLSLIIGHDKSAPNMAIKFLNSFGFYVMIGNSSI
jgi:hypothetical protein